jgi:hypothetical protein
MKLQSMVLQKNMQLALRWCSLNRSEEKFKNRIVLDNAHLHMADLTMMTLAILSKNIMKHPLYSPGLALSGFCLFRPLTEPQG